MNLLGFFKLLDHYLYMGEEETLVIVRNPRTKANRLLRPEDLTVEADSGGGVPCLVINIPADLS